MKRPRLIAFCVLSMSMLLFVAGSGFALSQELEDAYKNFFQSYNDEFYQQAGEQMPLKIQNDYVQFTLRIRVQNIDTMQKSIGLYISERENALGRNLTTEERSEITQEGWWDNEYDLHQQFAEKEKEMFPNAQERQKRQFQLQEGIMKRVESLGDPADIYSLLQIENNTIVRSLAQPDFLDLTPEQRDLIKEIQKEMNMKIFRISIKSGREQQEKVNEIARLQEKLRATQNDDEENDIQRKVQEMKVDIIKDYIPELKAVLIEGRESYMRVLTDAQKAKIKAVMDDMPDYMRNLFAAIDKQGGGLSILHNWQPGMGVPGVNPNREAPRERTNTGGGRAFPN